MPYPALETRPAGYVQTRPRRKAMSARGERIMTRIDMLGVTMPSVARRAGYATNAVYGALWRDDANSFLLECVEQALDLPKWKGQ